MQTGELIKQQRKLKKTTQKQLAEAIDVSEPSIRLYELGKRTPSEAIIRQIAAVLEVCPEALHSYDTDSAREVLEMLPPVLLPMFAFFSAGSRASKRCIFCQSLFISLVTAYRVQYRTLMANHGQICMILADTGWTKSAVYLRKCVIVDTR